ncbi:hypothetical protein M427DRAFT_142012 [Gonapodya prolifera JEL478]|uniref:CRAL-TRIO domain-containing protein n=1 Tax=Gonapodya prolifera (strain JEL478) TaxID=1344416 RepID=A0A139AXN0_GONPJ|nr:hypothetical protein M427DRAFT_142012 [Gonapodya prolifera JEL478]|eukprot:KXS21502.1 hypothetical protein M427DRAFT_142012 [Gonapodya prolifera JEL478]
MSTVLDDDQPVPSSDYVSLLATHAQSVREVQRVALEAVERAVIRTLNTRAWMRGRSTSPAASSAPRALTRSNSVTSDDLADRLGLRLSPPRISGFQGLTGQLTPGDSPRADEEDLFDGLAVEKDQGDALKRVINDDVFVLRFLRRHSFSPHLGIQALMIHLRYRLTSALDLHALPLPLTTDGQPRSVPLPIPISQKSTSSVLSFQSQSASALQVPPVASTFFRLLPPHVRDPQGRPVAYFLLREAQSLTYDELTVLFTGILELARRFLKDLNEQTWWEVIGTNAHLRKSGDQILASGIGAAVPSNWLSEFVSPPINSAGHPGSSFSQHIMSPQSPATSPTAASFTSVGGSPTHSHSRTLSPEVVSLPSSLGDEGDFSRWSRLNRKERRGDGDDDSDGGDSLGIDLSDSDDDLAVLKDSNAHKVSAFAAESDMIEVDGTEETRGRARTKRRRRVASRGEGERRVSTEGSNTPVETPDDVHSAGSQSLSADTPIVGTPDAIEPPTTSWRGFPMDSNVALQLTDGLSDSEVEDLARSIGLILDDKTCSRTLPLIPQFAIVIDVDGIGVSGMNTALPTCLLSFLPTHFPSFISTAYIINAGWVQLSLWSVLRGVLPASVAGDARTGKGKVAFVDGGWEAFRKEMGWENDTGMLVDNWDGSIPSPEESPVFRHYTQPLHLVPPTQWEVLVRDLRKRLATKSTDGLKVDTAQSSLKDHPAINPAVPNQRLSSFPIPVADSAPGTAEATTIFRQHSVPPRVRPPRSRTTSASSFRSSTSSLSSSISSFRWGAGFPPTGTAFAGGVAGYSALSGRALGLSGRAGTFEALSRPLVERRVEGTTADDSKRPDLIHLPTVIPPPMIVQASSESAQQNSHSNGNGKLQTPLLDDELVRRAEDVPTSTSIRSKDRASKQSTALSELIAAATVSNHSRNLPWGIQLIRTILQAPLRAFDILYGKYTGQDIVTLSFLVDSGKRTVGLDRQKRTGAPSVAVPLSPPAFSARHQLALTYISLLLVLVTIVHLTGFVAGDPGGERRIAGGKMTLNGGLMLSAWNVMRRGSGKGLLRCVKTVSRVVGYS